MHPHRHPTPVEDKPVDLGRTETGFSEEIRHRSGVNVDLCWHCNTCASGCPFSHAMDYMPNRILRMVQLGLRQEVLSCASIWLCVGCSTCATQCPNAIDMAAVTDILRQMAIEKNAAVAQPAILSFHREVLSSIERHGRTHKLEIMLRYKLHNRDWFSDMALGVKMLAKRKLELLPHKNRNPAVLRRLFHQSHAL